MNNHRFNIIIPTRERADMLYHSLKTCVAQNYDNLQILISDNYSQDQTKEVVSSFKDSRIKYINTGKRLSMSHNWEFALNHVDEGMVCFLGDDDGFLFDSISHLNKLVCDTGLTTITWEPDRYYWPSWTNNPRTNLLTVSLKRTHRIIDAAQQRDKIIRCEAGYGATPWLYKGFAEISDVNRVKAVTKTFFHSMIPDVYSGIALLNVVKNFVFSDKPYAIDANSGKSNSGMYKNDDPRIKDAIPFLREDNIPYHPKLSICLSGSVMQAESIYQALDSGILPKRYEGVDLSIFLTKAIEEVRNSPIQRYETQITIIKEIAYKNRLDMKLLEEVIKKNRNKPFNDQYDYNVTGYNAFKKRIDIQADRFGIKNVYEATLLHKKILDAPSEYIGVGAKFLSTMKFITRELKKRYL